MADSKKTPAEEQGITNPFASGDPAIDDEKLENLDPQKVVGTWAEQPDPNAEKPAPLPNVPPGAKKAPADDEPGTPAIGDGKNDGKSS